VRLRAALDAIRPALQHEQVRNDALVAHTLSYSNPDELRIRVTALAKATSWTP
jgi:hypothetical protein